MGRTCIEEFLFYFLMQFFSIALYAYFTKHAGNPAAIHQAKAVP